MTCACHSTVAPAAASTGSGIDEARVEKHPAAQRTIALAQAAHDAMIEGMDRVALGLRAGVQGAKEHGIEVLLDALHLHPHIHAAQQGEDLAQQRDGLAVGEVMLLDRVESQVADPAQALEDRVVMDDDGAVMRRMDVEFDPFCTQGPGATKGGATVLVLVAGCTTVSDAERSSHGVRMSGRTTIAAGWRSGLHSIYLPRHAMGTCRPVHYLGDRFLNTIQLPSSTARTW